ncbi:MAG: tetratricopeptide repeat protein [Oligoflexia bacterium]|nr:tetratricopeptide repeat protein [Oligoflexia bacterium]MBF0366426.1 tetratricopeptide repeat protein [Oligoflexia bacterium]
MKSLQRILLVGIWCWITLLLAGCEMITSMEKKAKVFNHYEGVALTLEKENRDLQVAISKLEYEIQSLKARNSYLELKISEAAASGGNDFGDQKHDEKVGRRIASVKSSAAHESDDPINVKVYRWKADQLLTMAENSFGQNDFEKASQYFTALLREYPDYSEIDDFVLFEAGVAAFKSGKYNDLSITYLQTLISKYPTSKYYRGAKLWLALANHQQGNESFFYKTIEEFRLKYRNTTEWKILSAYYENIRNQYKR